MKINAFCLALLSGAILASCSHNDGWKVSGTIANAPEGAKVAVDSYSNIGWYCLDSVALDKNGSFAYNAKKPAQHPDVYRITLDGKSICFPIDSVDHVTINADASDLLGTYSLTGTPDAELFVVLDGIINEAVAEKGVDAAIVDPELKRTLSGYILGDSIGIVSYYLINKHVADKPLFSLANSMDVKLIGATANKFAVSRPDDPRTKTLEAMYMQGRRNLGQGGQTVIEADAAGLFEIELYDVKGVKHSLAETADNAKLTLLSFTIYNSDPSAAYTLALNKVYEKYRDKGLAIYQVGLDPDESMWGQSAIGMPWTAVYSNPADSQQLVMQYNIYAIPLTYVINADGDIVERVDDPTTLESVIAKYL